jgi:CheY-specific phosphatase CheX
MSDFAETLNASLVALFRDGQTVSYKPLKVEKFYESTYEISCHMGFYDASGQTAGVALLNISRNNLMEMWSNVLGLPAEEDDTLAIAGELVNMIVGNASALIATTGQIIHIALPQIIDCTHQIKLSTFKRDDFHYFEFSGPNLCFNWVLCLYDAIGFA